MFEKKPASALDHVFDDWASFRWSSFRPFGMPEPAAWSPKIDVFARGNYLVTRVDLPGMKKEDVTVEVSDGYLMLTGERKRETEEKKDNFYRSEREHGSFYRSVPMPAGVKLEDVKATFTNGVLEVSVPMPSKQELKPQKVTIEEPAAAKTAA